MNRFRQIELRHPVGYPAGRARWTRERVAIDETSYSAAAVGYFDEDRRIGDYSTGSKCFIGCGCLGFILAAIFGAVVCEGCLWLWRYLS